MGTHASVNIIDDNEVISSIYVHYDGYTELPGLGADLYYMLRGYTVGCSGSGDRANYANGMGCLAAQIVKNLKQGVGGVYLNPMPKTPVTRNESGIVEVEALSQECILRYGASYVYTIYMLNHAANKPLIAIYSAVGGVLYHSIISYMGSRFHYPNSDPRVETLPQCPPDKLNCITVGAKVV